jgi:hypothetical protein
MKKFVFHVQYHSNYPSWTDYGYGWINPENSVLDASLTRSRPRRIPSPSTCLLLPPRTRKTSSLA